MSVEQEVQVLQGDYHQFREQSWLTVKQSMPAKVTVKQMSNLLNFVLIKLFFNILHVLFLKKLEVYISNYRIMAKTLFYID